MCGARTHGVVAGSVQPEAAACRCQPPFMLEQLAGAGVRVCCGAFHILELPDSLRHIGLTQAVGPAGGSKLDAGSVVRDNVMACTMGKLALAVASEFLTREIWRIRGWPTGLAPLTTATTGLVAEKVVSRCHADYDRWVCLKQQVCNTRFPRQPQGEHLCWSISFGKLATPRTQTSLPTDITCAAPLMNQGNVLEL